MTAETWQPGDTLPSLPMRRFDGIQGVCHHDLIELSDDHDFYCRLCYRFTGWQLANFWKNWSQLGPHNDTLPPLPWLHGPAA